MERFTLCGTNSQLFVELRRIIETSPFFDKQPNLEKPLLITRNFESRANHHSQIHIPSITHSNVVSMVTRTLSGIAVVTNFYRNLNPTDQKLVALSGTTATSL